MACGLRQIWHDDPASSRQPTLLPRVTLQVSVPALFDRSVSATNGIHVMVKCTNNVDIMTRH